LAVFNGGAGGLESGNFMSRSYMYLYPPIIYIFRNIYKVLAGAAQPSSLLVVATVDALLPQYRVSPLQNMLTTPSS